MLSLFPFLKTAGAKLFGIESDEDKTKKLTNHLRDFGFNLDGITVAVDDDKVTLSGEVNTLEEEKRLLVAAGNVKGIKEVEDRLDVREPVEVQIEPQEAFYEVVRGDSLSKIAKRIYGDPMKYTAIFDANKPMLKHPDRIYPGQVLVIPPKSEV